MFAAEIWKSNVYMWGVRNETVWNVSVRIIFSHLIITHFHCLSASRHIFFALSLPHTPHSFSHISLLLWLNQDCKYNDICVLSLYMLCHWYRGAYCIYFMISNMPPLPFPLVEACVWYECEKAASKEKCHQMLIHTRAYIEYLRWCWW